MELAFDISCMYGKEEEEKQQWKNGQNRKHCNSILTISKYIIVIMQEKRLFLLSVLFVFRLIKKKFDLRIFVVVLRFHFMFAGCSSI